MLIFACFAMLILGLLVMFRVIPAGKAWKYILVGTLICVGTGLTNGAGGPGGPFISGNYPWWLYIIFILGVLVLLRLFLNFLFPWRKK